MEKTIVDEMKKNEAVKKNFTDDELNILLQVLILSESDAKKQNQFINLIKGEDK